MECLEEDSINDRLTYMYLRSRNAVHAVLHGEASEAGELDARLVLLAIAVDIILGIIACVAPDWLGLVTKDLLELSAK